MRLFRRKSDQQLVNELRRNERVRRPAGLPFIVLTRRRRLHTLRDFGAACC